MELRERTFRVRCFQRADSWFSRLVRIMTALHEGFWLGFLNADDLNAITAARYGESQYLASTEHNLSGFFSWETPVLERYFRRGSRVLVGAAGAGRELLALHKCGFEADGFECCLPLVRASQEIFDKLGESKSVFPSSPDSVPPGPADYDGLIVGWSAYTHIPTKVRRIAFLQALRQRALPHSPLLVSFFTRGPSSRYEAVVHRTATICSLVLRGRRPLELGDRLSLGHYTHSFTRDELEAEMTSAGFRVAHYSELGERGHAVGIAE
jgi:hypothetical protein